MDAQAALVRAIIDEPDDDTHRLVFADWLEENDASEWASLIRAQCAQNRLLVPADDPYIDPSLLPLGSLKPGLRRQIAARLLGAIAEEWAGEEAPAQPLLNWKLRRGFPEYVEVWGDGGIKRLVSNARHLFERIPLAAIALRSYLPNIWGGPFGGPYSSIRKKALASFLGLGQLARLRHLDLRGGSTSQHLGTILKAAPTLPQTRVWLCESVLYHEPFAEQVRGAFGSRLVVTRAHADNSSDEIPF